jgi:hypothetical protein
VKNLSRITAVDAYLDSSFALKDDGTVWTWGEGVGTVPQRVGGLGQIIAIAIGIHRLALRDDGTVWTWGANSSGELGNGSVQSRTVPRAIVGLGDVVTIGAGQSCSFAVQVDGTAWAWGSNVNGCLGDGTEDDAWFPVRVDSLRGASVLDGGRGHCVAIISGSGPDQPDRSAAVSVSLDKEPAPRIYSTRRVPTDEYTLASRRWRILQVCSWLVVGIVLLGVALTWLSASLIGGTVLLLVAGLCLIFGAVGTVRKPYKVRFDSTGLLVFEGLIGSRVFKSSEVLRITWRVRASNREPLDVKITYTSGSIKLDDGVEIVARLLRMHPNLDVLDEIWDDVSAD